MDRLIGALGAMVELGYAPKRIGPLHVFSRHIIEHVDVLQARQAATLLYGWTGIP